MVLNNGVNIIQRRRKTGRGTARAEDAQGTPTQSHISPSIQVYEDVLINGGYGLQVARGGESVVLIYTDRKRENESVVLNIFVYLVICDYG